MKTLQCKNSQDLNSLLNQIKWLALTITRQNGDSKLSSKPTGLLNFDLQTKRPEFVQYAAQNKPHDNRFLNLNLDSLAFSKNARPKSIDFSKQLQRKSDYLVSKSVLEDSSKFLSRDDEKQTNKPYKYMQSQIYEPPLDTSKCLQKPLRNYSIQFDKALPRKFLIDEKKALESGGKIFNSEELYKAYNNQGHVSNKGKGRQFSRYAARGDPESSLPYFMQNYSNRQSLSLILQKSLKETNFSNAQYIPQISSFKLSTNSEISKNNKKFKLSKPPTQLDDPQFSQNNSIIQNFITEMQENQVKLPTNNKNKITNSISMNNNSNYSGKKKAGKTTTFYKLLQEGGYIKESVNLNKDRAREWHVKKIKTNLDDDFDSDSD
eukprot:403352343